MLIANLLVSDLSFQFCVMRIPSIHGEWLSTRICADEFTAIAVRRRMALRRCAANARRQLFEHDGSAHDLYEFGSQRAAPFFADASISALKSRTAASCSSGVRLRVAGMRISFCLEPTI